MRRLFVLLALALALAVPARAYADDPPWARGVTAEQKKAAQVLLDQGNTLFVTHDYVAALDKYKQAIAQWDHPAIRFNIVRCLVQLDRALEADDELRHALAYGAAPLEDSVYNEALAYDKLLANQIAHVAVHCTQPGVDISLDGQHVVSCPGEADTRVIPGAHQIVGTHEGFLAKAVSVVVVGGKHEDVAIELVPIPRDRPGGVVVRRWDRAKPWIVVGAGAGVAAIGAVIDDKASRDMAAYNRAFTVACADLGCGPSRPVPASVEHQRTHALHESDAGIAGIGVGLAAAITGGVLVYVNRERTIYPAEHLDVTPRAGGATVSLTGHF